jgi:hypothetical protein
LVNTPEAEHLEILPTFVTIADPVLRSRAQSASTGQELGEFNEQVAIYIDNPRWREHVDSRAAWYRAHPKRVRSMFERRFPLDWRDYLIIERFATTKSRRAF